MTVKSSLRGRIGRIFLLPAQKSQYIGGNKTQKTFEFIQFENYNGKLENVPISKVWLKFHDSKYQILRVSTEGSRLTKFIMLDKANIRHIPMIWAIL